MNSSLNEWKQAIEDKLDSLRQCKAWEAVKGPATTPVVKRRLGIPGVKIH